MLSLPDMLQQESADLWLLMPSALLLGALHGLEPGHSKTMMAAFIVAVRGTVRQAVLLGLSATVSHTLVVWTVVLGGMYLWHGLNAVAAEPYLQIASGLTMVALAAWMLARLWQHRRARDAAHPSGHMHSVAHGTVHSFDTGHGTIGVAIYGIGDAARWRITMQRNRGWEARDLALSIERPDGAVQIFSFIPRDGYLESAETVTLPHEFMARLRLGHGDHFHDYDIAYLAHGDGVLDQEMHGLESAAAGYQDAHELAHANDIRHRFAGKSATTGQIVLFGLTGGLIPCPAAITVLLLCLQLKRTLLGIVLVAGFSIGLALTMVAAGVVAALSIRHLDRHWDGFGLWTRRAPFVSGIVVAVIGITVAWQGWLSLAQ